VLFVNTPLGDNIGGRKATSGRSLSRPRNNSNGRTEDLPKAKKVSLFNGLGRLFEPHNTETLKSMFAGADAGYEVTVKDATIENLKRVSGDAIFYINTHGGAGQLHTKYGPRQIMALWTKEFVTAAGDVNYKTELDEERMCYMFATNDTRACEFHYAITSKFVREYMSFGENSFLYLDACNGANESITGNVAFRERMIAKAVNEKATFVGWTGVTNNGDGPLASQFVFDRLLGANYGGIISQEDPFQRPFDLAAVIEDMRNEGLGIVRANGSYLTYKTTMQDEVLLRPTIESMDIDEFTSTLTITGLFPWDEGHVGVDNVSVAVTSWSPNEITCIIPETGDGSVGDVVVISAEGVKSNPVPLTEYLIKLNYSSDAMGVKFAGVCTLRLRADVHLRRSKIGETPTRPTYFDLSQLASGRIFNVKGSQASYAISGSRYDVCNLTNCHVQFTESPTPRVGSVAYSKLIPGEKMPLFAMYNWGPEMKTIRVNLISINASTRDVIEERVKCPPEPGEAVAKVEQSYAAAFAFPFNASGATLDLEIAENFNIRPGTWDMSLAQPWSPCNIYSQFKEHLSWDVIVPNKPPTDKTSARDATDPESN
jgi:hypothetical protein